MDNRTTNQLFFGWPCYEAEGLKMYLCHLMYNPRIVLAIFFPPLSVAKRGFLVVLLVIFLTMLGWIPGVILALVLSGKNHKPNWSESKPSKYKGKIRGAGDQGL